MTTTLHGVEIKMAAPGGATEVCKQSRKCSKAAGHKGQCNSEKPVIPFWESSPVFQLNTHNRKLIEEEKQFEEIHEGKRLLLIDREQALKTNDQLINTLLNEKGKTFYK